MAIKKSELHSSLWKTTRALTNGRLLSAVYVPVPKKEQKAIAVVLDDMESEIAILEEKRDKTKLFKQGMIQELLTGKTRLI